MALVLLLLLVAALVAVAWLVRERRHTLRKIRFLFNAIDNADYTFTFDDRSSAHADRLTNRALNRVKTLLEHARDEQIEREKYYEHILNATDTGILVVDEQGRVLQHNRAALTLLHLPALTHLRQARAHWDDPSLARHETQAELGGKRVRIVALSNVERELDDQQVDSWLQLTRVLTHEIMNAVTPIASISQSLLLDASDAGEADAGEARQRRAEGLRAICDTSRGLLRFVDNYRQFSRLPQPQPKSFYLKPLLDRAARLAAPYGHRVEVSVEPPDLLLYADESLIDRVLTNLVKNAAEAIGQDSDGRIRLHAFVHEDDSVVIDVTDNGAEIDDELARHIFVPFFTTKPTGSGIGLSLSRQIMRQTGGTLTLLRDHAQRLTTFRLRFP